MNPENVKHNGSCCETTPAKDARYIDPICGMAVNDTKTEFSSICAGVTYHFCSNHCQKIFAKNKEDDHGKHNDHQKEID